MSTQCALLPLERDQVVVQLGWRVLRIEQSGCVAPAIWADRVFLSKGSAHEYARLLRRGEPEVEFRVVEFFGLEYTGPPPRAH